MGCGATQGSVLGSVLFLLYTIDIGNIAQRHNMGLYSYTDDNQLYTQIDANTQS